MGSQQTATANLGDNVDDSATFQAQQEETPYDPDQVQYSEQIGEEPGDGTAATQEEPVQPDNADPSNPHEAQQVHSSDYVPQGDASDDLDDDEEDDGYPAQDASTIGAMFNESAQGQGQASQMMHNLYANKEYPQFYAAYLEKQGIPLEMPTDFQSYAPPQVPQTFTQQVPPASPHKSPSQSPSPTRSLNTQQAPSLAQTQQHPVKQYAPSSPKVPPTHPAKVQTPTQQHSPSPPPHQPPQHPAPSSPLLSPQASYVLQPQQHQQAVSKPPAQQTPQHVHKPPVPQQGGKAPAQHQQGNKSAPQQQLNKQTSQQALPQYTQGTAPTQQQVSAPYTQSTAPLQQHQGANKHLHLSAPLSQYAPPPQPASQQPVPYQQQPTYAPFKQQAAYAPPQQQAAYAPPQQQAQYAPPQQQAAYAPPQQQAAYAPPSQKTSQVTSTSLTSTTSQQMAAYAPQQQHNKLSEWVGTAQSTPAIGTKQQPLHINELIKVVHRMGLGVGKGGAQNSVSKAVRFFNEAELLDPKTEATSGNSSPSKYYYVDITCDIESSRRASKSLATRHYYDLNGAAEGVDPQLVSALSERLAEVTAGISGQIRLPVYAATDTLMASVRIFEMQQSSSGASLEVHVTEGEGDGVRFVPVALSSESYLKFTGKARVTGTLSGVMIANGYIKLIFTARSLLLRGSATKRVGGVEGAAAKTGDTVLDDLIAHIRTIVDSGIPVHMIRSVIDEGLSHRIAEVSSDALYSGLVGSKPPQMPMNPYGVQQQKAQQYAMPPPSQPKQAPYAPYQQQAQYAPPQQQAAYAPPQQQAQYAPPQQQAAYAPPQQQAQYAPPQQQAAYAPPQQQAAYAPPQQQTAYAPPQQYQPQQYPSLNLGGATPQYHQ